ncbi:MAG: hypothetical protein ACP5MT_00405, partial [Candidatus Acidifodinimicrobium sp.]
MLHFIDCTPYEDFKLRFDRLLNNVLSTKRLSPESKSLIKNHIAFLQAQGVRRVELQSDTHLRSELHGQK